MPLLIPATTVPADGSFIQLGGASMYATGFLLIGTASVDLVMQYSTQTGQTHEVEYLSLPPGQYSLAPSVKNLVTGFRIRAAGGAASSGAQYQLGLSEPTIPSIIPAGAGVGSPFSVSPRWQHNDVLVAAEPAGDFEDGGGVTWTLTDDPANGRMKIAASVTSVVPLDDYVFKNANTTVTATGHGDSSNLIIQGNTVTLDGATRVKIEFFAPCVEFNAGVNNQAMGFELWDSFNGGAITDKGTMAFVTGNINGGTCQLLNSVKAEIILTPAAGTHKFAVYAWRNVASGTCIVFANTFVDGTGNFAPCWYRLTQT